MILTRMKEAAEAYLGHGVTHAVITVPACKFLQLVWNSFPRNLLTMTHRLQRRSTTGNEECRQNCRTQGPPSPQWTHCSRLSIWTRQNRVGIQSHRVRPRWRYLWCISSFYRGRCFRSTGHGRRYSSRRGRFRLPRHWLLDQSLQQKNRDGC